nr:class I SAM-dependent methyltransferase [uncultured Roseococcus sp.]
MMTPERVKLTGAKETLLVTLAAKAGESLLPDSLLHDHFAAEAVARIDYDFARLGVDRDLMVGLALRSYLLDVWTRDFLARHPRAVVLHLGCGLDSRVFRIDPGPDVLWFDADFPEVVALRRRLYPKREGVTLIGTSVTEPDWIAQLPTDRPRLILAEGLLPYIAAEEVPPLLDRLTAGGPGGELAFDAYSRLGLWMIRNNGAIRRTGAELRWFLEDPAELERQVPRLRLLQELLPNDPEGCSAEQLARLSPVARWAALACRIVPAFGKVGRLLRYAF